MTLKPYEQPTPAFGPGSVGYARKQTEALELLNESEVDASQTETGTRKDYAGAGAYY